MASFFLSVWIISSIYLLLERHFHSQTLRAAIAFLLWQPVMLMFSLALLQFNKSTDLKAVHLFPILILLFSCFCGWCCHQKITQFFTRQWALLRSLPRLGLPLLLIKPDAPLSSRFQSIQLTSVNALTALYVAISFVLSAFSIVTNGDAQTYNISRLGSAILAKQVFFAQTSIPTQAFHSFSHDYLYVPDLIYGNIKGLGLLCFVELIFLLHFVDHMVRLSQESENLFQGASLQSRILARFLIISMPAIFFQSNNVKNDLVFAPLTLALSIVIASLASKQSPDGHEKSGWRNLFLVALLGLLTLYGCKGYGVLFVLSLSLIAACMFLRFRLHLSAIFSRSGLKRIFKVQSNIASRLTCALLFLTLFTALANVGFEVNKQAYWGQAYSQFVAMHGPRGFDIVKAFPFTFARLLLEASINVPTFHVWTGEIFPGLFNDRFTLGGVFRFGGQINQDISWPGIVFNVCFLWTLSLVVLRKIFLVFHPSLRPSPSCEGVWFEMSRLLFVSALCIAFTLALLLYWQPGFSRFFVSVAALMVPFMAVTISNSLGSRNLV